MKKLKAFWESKNKFQKVLLSAAGVLVLFIGLVGGVGSQDNDLSAEPSTSAEESAQEQVEESEPAQEQVEESEPAAPVQDLSTEEGLSAAIEEALGSTTNREVPRNVTTYFDGRDLFVDFALNDNLSSKMIRQGGWVATETILVLAQESKLIDNLTVHGTFELIDKLGNSLGEQYVFNVYFFEDIIPKINTDAFVSSMYADVATDWSVHPAIAD
jgi:hypothetical protein